MKDSDRREPMSDIPTVEETTLPIRGLLVEFRTFKTLWTTEVLSEEDYYHQIDMLSDRIRTKMFTTPVSLSYLARTYSVPEYEEPLRELLDEFLVMEKGLDTGVLSQEVFNEQFDNLTDKIVPILDRDRAVPPQLHLG